MNILVVHEKNWRAKNVYELHGYAESLSLRGHSIFAIEYDEVWEKDHIFDFGHLAAKRFPNTQRMIEDGSVTLIRPGTVKLPFVSRLSSGLTYLSTASNVIQQEKIDVIWMYSVPTYGMQTIWLARRHNIPVLFRAIDIPTQLVPTPLLRAPTAMLEKQIYPNVDKVLALTPKLRQYVIELGAPEEQVDLLLPTVRTDLFKPDAPNRELMQKWGITESDQVVLYMGRMYSFSGLDSLISNFGRVLDHAPNAKLLIVGRGEEFDNLVEQARATSYSERIIFTDYQPYYLMPDFINLSRVCTIPFELCDATETIIPSKALEYLACGVPVVSTRLPGTVDILSGVEDGVLYAEDSIEFVEQIIYLLADNSMHEQVAKAALNCINKKFSWTSTIDQLESYFVTAMELKYDQMSRL